MAARDFRLLFASDKALLLNEAKKIADTYVVVNAPHQVNIRGETQRNILDAIDKQTVDILTFEEAQTEILRLLDKDSFVRFKQSEFFSNFLADAHNAEKALGMT